MPQRYEVHYSEEAEEMLAKVKDRRVQTKLADLVDGLALDPELRGKPLMRDLFGFRSIRGIGQRYRIVYRVDPTALQVVVYGLGLRKEGDREDIYELMRRAVHPPVNPGVPAPVPKPKKRR